MAELIALALELIPEDSPEAGNLLSALGGLKGSEAGNYHEAQMPLNRALAIARREKDLGLELRTLLTACQVDLFHLRLREGQEKGLVATELAQRVGAQSVEQIARFYVFGAGLSMGGLNEVQGQVHWQDLPLDPEKVVGRDWQARLLWGSSLLHYFEGDWQAAREVSDRGLKLAPMDPQHLSVRALLEYQTGELSTGEAYLDRLLETELTGHPR